MTETEYDYTFSPWTVKDNARIVKGESGWINPIKCDRHAQIVAKQLSVLVPVDVFEDWTGPMLNAASETLTVDKSELDPTWYVATDMTSHRYLTMQDVRNRLFRLIDATPHLDWLASTKRPENVVRMTFDAWCKKVPGHVSQNEGDGRRWRWPKNVWLGTSVEDQQTADERIPHLLQTPAAVRFLSCEPLLGPVDLWQWLGCPDDGVTEARPGTRLLDAGRAAFGDTPLIDLVVVGGESGPHARPCDVVWIRSIVQQCKAAGVKCFVKQLGSL